MEELNEYETSLAGGNEVSENLRKIADKRTDIFGEEELTEIGRKIGETKKKKVEKNTWDGHTGGSSKPGDNSSIDQQIKNIHLQNKGIQQKPPPPHMMGMHPPQGFGLLPPGAFPPPHMMGMHPPPPGAFPMMPPRMGYNPMGGPPLMRTERPDPDGQPPHKKLKPNDGRLEPEKDWLDKHPGTLLVVIQTPNMPDKPQWNLNGQLERIQVVMSDKVSSLKDKISEKLGGMPANKQKLKSEIGFWKDNKTLAYYNSTNGMMLELGIKERGGRKK
jgi:splicing factor 3A subunit 1